MIQASKSSVSGIGRAAVLIASLAVALHIQAQPPGRDSVAVQREAMEKLSFLTGRWSGSVTIFRGPGEPFHLTQGEVVEYKLNGLVLLVEGASKDAAGKQEFSALATIAFDDETHTYRFRAYNDGHYVDTEMLASNGGFSWRFSTGPAQIVNTMHLTPGGEWAETTDVSVGGAPAHRSVDMLLQKQQ